MTWWSLGESHGILELDAPALELHWLWVGSQALGFTVEPPRGGGSHWKVRGPDGAYPIPAHNGLKEQVPDHYIRALCRFIKVDFHEFRARL